MSRDVAQAPRSPYQRAAVALLVAGAIVAAYVAATISLAQVLAAHNNVELAHALAPADGRITALRAALLASPEATAADRRHADWLAAEALRRDPTAVLAASTLGIDDEARGDRAGARRMFAYAEKLSRRDLQTQLWAIEEAVARNDIAGALRHHDVALRTHPTIWAMLFPVLAVAASDLQIRGPLVGLLASRPRWGRDFLDYLAVHGPDPKGAVPIFADLRRARVAIPESTSTRLIAALIKAGVADDAWAFYASVRPGVDRSRSRDARFLAELAAPSPFDWTIGDGAGLSASIQPEGGGGVFEFAAASGSGGPLLRQVQALPPGAYQLEGHGAGIDQAEPSRPYWVLTCQDGHELGRIVLPNSDQSSGTFMGRFGVPTGCPVQILELVARPSDRVSGSSGRIDRVQLSRLR